MIANRTCVISSTWEKGAGKLGTSKGPSRILSLIESAGLQYSSAIEISPNSENLGNTDSAKAMTLGKIDPMKNGLDLIAHCHELSNHVEHLTVNGNHTLILSGDHSNAIGSVSGLCRAVGGEHLGVIWIDAHLDLHSPYTTPSGNTHGMSVNALLGDDNRESAIRELNDEQIDSWERLKSIKKGKPSNCILPENLIFIATRSYEEQEWDIIEKHKILVIRKEEIDTKGMDWLLETINERLQHCSYRYVSFDVDSMDSSISSATGTPEDHGLDLAITQSLLSTLWNHPRTISMEITEFNPSLPYPEKLESALLICLQGLVG